MNMYVVEHRFDLGGTNYAERIAAAFATHPEVAEVVETKIESAGKEGGYAADLRFVYRAERKLGWWDLCSMCKGVPLYEPLTEEQMRRLREFESSQQPPGQDS